VGPWLARGIITSGYPAYPATIGAFDVDWRVPRERAVNEANWIRSWARRPGVHWSEVLGNYRWLRPWLAETMTLKFDVLFPLALAAVGGLGIAGAAYGRRGGPGLGRRSFLFLLPHAASLVYWFVTAPDKRFAGATFWALGAGVASLGVKGWARPSRTAPARVAAAGALAFAVLANAGHYRFRGAGEDRGFHPLPVTVLETFVTESGLELSVPSEENKEECWWAPLPCTPYPDPGLRLRREGDFRYGFVSESEGLLME
jgi:hypothetical protein